MDYFFAQVEERENPSLKGRPVVVGADPKEGRGRGVVSTANYEARKFGIHSGMPISWAYRACPEAIFLRPRHDFYQQVSLNIRKVIEMSSKESPWSLEQVSIDEFYLDLSGLKNWSKAEDFCQNLKEQVWKNEGLSCSIGLSVNKLLAKIASAFKKPDGFTLVGQDQVRTFLSPLPIEVLPGVGPKTTEILNYQGVKKIVDLRKLGLKKLSNLFGKWGQHIWEASLGVNNSEVFESEEKKTLGVQTTFARDTENFYFLRRTLFDLCQKVWQDLEEEKLSAKMIEVTIRYFDFETHSHQKTLPKPFVNLYQLRTAAQDLLKRLLKQKSVRLVGVRTGKLAKDSFSCPPLL